MRKRNSRQNILGAQWMPSVSLSRCGRGGTEDVWVKLGGGERLQLASHSQLEDTAYEGRNRSAPRMQAACWMKGKKLQETSWPDQICKVLQTGLMSHNCHSRDKKHVSVAHRNVVTVLSDGFLTEDTLWKSSPVLLMTSCPNSSPTAGSSTVASIWCKNKDWVVVVTQGVKSLLGMSESQLLCFQSSFLLMRMWKEQMIPKYLLATHVGPWHPYGRGG